MAAGFHLFTISSEAPGFSFGVEEFSTGALETVTVRLGDGTIVRLAPSSGLRMDGTDGARNVWLEGQAFFAVAHHEEMPFTLHTRAGTATVLGTRFDVRAEDDDFRLVVVEGRVRVEAAVDGQPARELGPSEMTRIIEGGRLYVSQVPDVHALLDWMEGALIFQSTRLDRVAEELEHRYGISVEVVDPGVAGRTITAWFTDQPLAEAVRVICRAADVVCDVSETSVRIGM